MRSADADARAGLQPRKSPPREQRWEDVENPIENPIEDSIGSPVEKPIEKPIEEPIENPIEKTIEEPIEKPIELIAADRRALAMGESDALGSTAGSEQRRSKQRRSKQRKADSGEASSGEASIRKRAAGALSAFQGQWAALQLHCRLAAAAAARRTPSAGEGGARVGHGRDMGGCEMRCSPRGLQRCRL